MLQQRTIASSLRRYVPQPRDSSVDQIGRSPSSPIKHCPFSPDHTREAPAVEGTVHRGVSPCDIKVTFLDRKLHLLGRLVGVAYKEARGSG